MGMTDKYLEHAISCLNRAKENPTDGVYCELSIPEVDMILNLLKEQEAVKPIKKDTIEITARYEFDCQCGTPLLFGQPYCAICGKSVKWK